MRDIISLGCMFFNGTNRNRAGTTLILDLKADNEICSTGGVLAKRPTFFAKRLSAVGSNSSFGSKAKNSPTVHHFFQLFINYLLDFHLLCNM